MDTRTARSQLRDHLQFLQELGFLCVEPGFAREEEGHGTKPEREMESNDRPVADEPVADDRGGEDGSRGSEVPSVADRSRPPSTAATPPEPAGSPGVAESSADIGPESPGISIEPGEPFRSAVSLGGALANRPDWPERLFTRPSRPPLSVARPVFGNVLGGDGIGEDDLAWIGESGAGEGSTSKPAAETPDLFAEPEAEPQSRPGGASASSPPGAERLTGSELSGESTVSSAASPLPAPTESKESAAGEPPELPVEEQINRLSDIAQEVAECRRCRLCDSRTNVVPGQGNPSARIVFVGEGPGYHEDQQGLAFVGRAGQLLTDMIHAMKLTREDVFICNVVKCRPPENRTPAPDEMTACEPFLKRQLEILRPEVIIALGGVALKCLLRDPKLSITRIRGKWRKYEEIPLMPTFHPAYLLRNPGDKAPVWEDLQKVMQVFGLGNDTEKRGTRP